MEYTRICRQVIMNHTCNMIAKSDNYNIYIYSENSADVSESDNRAIREFYKVAGEYNAEKNGGMRLRVHLVLMSQALVNVLRRMPLEGEMARNIELYAYTVEDLWSMELLGIRPGEKALLDRKPITAESEVRVHLVLFGVTGQAESLAVHTALTAHFPNYCRDNSLRTRITWVGDSLGEFSRFRQQYRNLLENSFHRTVAIDSGEVVVNSFAPKYIAERRDFVDVEWEFVEGKSHSDAIRYKLCRWASDENQLLTVAFCYEGDDRNINEALALPLNSMPQFPVLLRVKDDASISFLKQSASFSQLKPFGMDDAGLNRMGEFIDMAQYINYAYCKMRSTSQSERERGATDMIVATELPTLEELQELWNNSVLTTAKRWSNIYNAFTLNTRMRSMGHPFDAWHKLFAVGDSEVEVMAEVEHNRWSVEELILGYTPTTADEHNAIMNDIGLRNKLKAEFKHDDLRNYSELGTDDTGLPVSRYDAAIIRTLPLIAYSYSISKGGKDE